MITTFINRKRSGDVWEEGEGQKETNMLPTTQKRGSSVCSEPGWAGQRITAWWRRRKSPSARVNATQIKHQPLKWHVTRQLICWGDTFAQWTWAEEGVKKKGEGVREKVSEIEKERQRLIENWESWLLTILFSLFFFNRTLDIIITRWSRGIYANFHI